MSKTHNIAPEDFHCYSCEDNLVGIEGEIGMSRRTPTGGTRLYLSVMTVRQVNTMVNTEYIHS